MRTPQFKLYGYWRSSASYRVRIALNLKGITYESVDVNLKGGEHLEPAFSEINPEKLLPVLECLETGTRLTQSLAIMEYLDTLSEANPLLPHNKINAAHARSFAYQICCDIHPIQNLRVLKYLKHEASFSNEGTISWANHWISIGLPALETIAQKRKTAFLFGETPGIAECALIPQLYNARRYEVDLKPFTALLAVEEECNALPAFDKARPENQNS